MIFIEGPWLRHAVHSLGSGFRADYNSLPDALAEESAKKLGLEETMLVKPVCFYDTVPVNFDPQDNAGAIRIRAVHDNLRSRGYNVTVYPMDYQGSRIRRDERMESTRFAPEKFVDMSLGAGMLDYARSDLYDVAIPLIGAGKYVPALQLVRKSGKRVVVATIRDNCSPLYTSTSPHEILRECYDGVIFLDDFVGKIEFRG